jgi:hypothetical protein
MKVENADTRVLNLQAGDSCYYLEHGDFKLYYQIDLNINIRSKDNHPLSHMSLPIDALFKLHSGAVEHFKDRYGFDITRYKDHFSINSNLKSFLHFISFARKHNLKIIKNESPGYIEFHGDPITFPYTFKRHTTITDVVSILVFDGRSGHKINQVHIDKIDNYMYELKDHVEREELKIKLLEIEEKIKEREAILARLEVLNKRLFTVPSATIM